MTFDYQDYLDNKICLQNEILEYINEQEDSDGIFINLATLIEKQNITKSRESLKVFLYLINKISDNMHRSPDFFQKIDHILSHYQKEIKQTFSNPEIFKIFQSNKRNLLLLFSKKIIEFDDDVINLITSLNNNENNYLPYFYPELKDKLSFTLFQMYEIEKYDNRVFNEKRKIGENDQHICELIRKDSIDEFVQYVNQTNYPLNAIIERSIFETNSFLLEYDPSLIEYAAFYGSIQIFKYLRLNNIEVKDSIFMYAIHGNNYELIHVIEEIIRNEDNEKILIFFIEAVKCHHNEIARYFDNIIFNGQSTSILGLCSSIFNFMNYSFFPDEIDNEYAFYFLCKYDQVDLVKLVLDDPSYMKGINVNNRIITKKNNIFLITFLTCCFFF